MPSLLLIFLICLIFCADASGAFPEFAYRDAWCAKNGGITEVVLSGGSRVDCLTETHAVEVEFARKWKESIGQALYYAKKTDRAPGIVLIKERPEDQKYLGRLIYTVKKNYPYIKIWVIKPEDLSNGVSDDNEKLLK